MAFPPPSPPCNVVPLFELPLENKKHPNFEWRGHGRGVDSYVSEVTLFEYNVSTILSPIAVLTVSKKHLHQHNIFDHFSMSILSFSRFYPRHYCGQTSEAFLLNLDINNYLVIFQRVFLFCQKLGPCSWYWSREDSMSWSRDSCPKTTYMKSAWQQTMPGDHCVFITINLWKWLEKQMFENSFFLILVIFKEL